ncbi:MAG TPA: M56 family metallopeptidase [Gemmatimonas sp.]|uniref:M56 family metallopeptidase n=1 Tax=Gemmatimonas sp. TaxID=1962908 RepID=UPI002ED8361C
MIALWMLSSIAFGALVVIAALMLDTLLQLSARQTRSVWIVATLSAVSWPLLAPMLWTPEGTTNMTRVLTTANAVVAGLPADIPSMPDLGTRLSVLDIPLLLAWAVTSLWLMVRWGLLARVLRRHMHDAEPRTVNGQSTLVTRDLGPAVIGVLRPRMVLPSWFFELDGGLRAMILSHEVEHVRARDQVTLTIARLLTILAPWNPAVWLLARRTRIATEVDCDRRVIRGGATASQYAQLLLFVAHRQHSHPLFAASPAAATLGSHMAGSPTTLRRRITAMRASPLSSRARTVRSLALGGAAIMVIAISASPRFARALASVRDARVLSPATATVQPPAKPMVEFKLDSQATLIEGTAPPRYPAELLASRTAGSSQAQLVVDTSGLVMTGSVKIVSASHPTIGQSVAQAAAAARFRPARVGGRNVKQLVRLVYHFNMPGVAPAPITVAPADIRTFEITVTAPR